MTHEGLYIIIQAVSTLLNGTLEVAWGPEVLEWSPAPHKSIELKNKKKMV